MAGTLPMPIKGMKSPKRAREGMVWKIPVTCKRASLIFLRLDKRMARGTATAMAMNRDKKDSCKCSERATIHWDFRSAKVVMRSCTAALAFLFEKFPHKGVFRIV